MKTGVWEDLGEHEAVWVISSKENSEVELSRLRLAEFTVNSDEQQAYLVSVLFFIFCTMNNLF